MTALQLYDPLLQYLCQVNRLARGGAQLSYGEVHAKVISLLEAIDKRAAEDPHLMEHVRELKTPVNYFIDDIISQNKHLAFRERWQEKRLGFVKDGLAGDDAFFLNHLDVELRKTASKAVAERLLVYYVCIGLGFQGRYFNELPRLQDYMRQITPAIRPWLAEDSEERLMPQTYQYTDSRDFIRPPELKRSLLLAGVCGLLLAGLPLYVLLANNLVAQLETQQHLREINESHQGVPWSQAWMK